MLSCKDTVNGVVRFVQVWHRVVAQAGSGQAFSPMQMPEDTVLVDGQITGLTPGMTGLRCVS